MFLFFPAELIGAINRISLLVNSSLPTLPPSTEKFWLALTMSLMTTLVVMSYWAQKDLGQYHFLVAAILVSKFASSFFFLAFFIFHQRSGAYLIGVFTDGLIFIITYYFYRRYLAARGLKAHG